MTLDGVFIALAAIKFIVFCNCVSWLVSPALLSLAFAPRRVKPLPAEAKKLTKNYVVVTMQL